MERSSCTAAAPARVYLSRLTRTIHFLHIGNSYSMLLSSCSVLYTLAAVDVCLHLALQAEEQGSIAFRERHHETHIRHSLRM